MKILVIFTGGTIGSSLNDGWIGPDVSAKKLLIENYKSNNPNNNIEFDKSTPYTILSENLEAEHINKLITTVHNAISKDYDGIIVTHGTDTLQFSSAALSYALGNTCKPVIVVSSNYPLNDERANGNTNFEAAVEFIKQNCGNGVFVAYRNSDNITYFHAGNALLSHMETDDNVYSINNNYFAEYSHNKITLHKSFVDCRPAVGETTELIDNPGILVFCPYPAENYNYNCDEYNAVIIRPYHSSTINTSSIRFRKFCNKAKASYTPVYVASVNVTAAYESSKEFEELGLKTYPGTTFTDTYVKTWYEISKKYLFK